MQVTQDEAIALFVDLGMTVAPKWAERPHVLAEKLNKLPAYCEGRTRCREEENQILLEKILEAHARGEEVGLPDGPLPQRQLRGGPKVVTPSPGVKKRPAVRGDGSPRKVGVISIIVACLEAASEAAPVSKEAILERLAEEFPERDRAGMKKTVGVQLSSLKRERGLNVLRGAAGYWIGG